jgi:precorrin-6B methylase 2
MTEKSSISPHYAQQIDPALLRNCKVLSNRSEILKLIPKNLVFAEVGVALGDLSQEVLSVCESKQFIAIDLFVLHHSPSVWGGRVGQVLEGKTHIEYYREKFRDAESAGRLRILKGDSADCLKQIANASVDVIYLDADHSYLSVKTELEISKSKIRPGGWIVLNDYIMADWLTNTLYGVVQAVNEFMNRERWQMLYFALQNGMFCDVVLQKL